MRLNFAGQDDFLHHRKLPECISMLSRNQVSFFRRYRHFVGTFFDAQSINVLAIVVQIISSIRIVSIVLLSFRKA